MGQGKLDTASENNKVNPAGKFTLYQWPHEEHPQKIYLHLIVYKGP